ncbi:MAG: WG repeat-containing protein [Clostridia bacterium]|nr:WG repeat-containing protein [Clostridia bacterium]
MKRVLLPALCLLLLLMPSAMGEEPAPEPLFPAYDKAAGKWGYIDTDRQWAIAPQFETAGVFRGEYAAASTGDPWEYTAGIIGTDGSWVVEPKYFVDDGYDGWTYGGLSEGLYILWDDVDDNDPERPHIGFFDVPSGYFSGLSYWGEFRWTTQERLVPIEDTFVDRTTGQTVITLPEGYITDWMGWSSVFHDGFAPILVDDPEEDRNEVCFVDLQGNVIELPALRFGKDDWACGLLCASERISDPGTAPVTGYFDLNTLAWKITSDDAGLPFMEAYPFSGSGFACVRLSGGSYGHIDTQGKVLFGDGYVTWETGSGIGKTLITGPYRFFGNYAWIEEANVLIDPAGQVVLVIPEGWMPCVQWDDELDHTRDYYVSPGGVIELQRRSASGGYDSALMKMDGEWLLDPEEYGRQYDISLPEAHRFFSEGLQPVIRNVGIREWRTVHGRTGDYQVPVYETRTGYVNERGDVAVDFLYASGGVFLNGLAMVQRDGMTGYVNIRGEEVYFWSSEDDEW